MTCQCAAAGVGLTMLHSRVFDSISMPPLVKVALAAAGAVAALLLPAYVGAFLAPGAGRLTVLAGKGSTSTISHQTLPRSLLPVANRDDAKDKLKDVLAANRGSTLAADVVAAAEVS